MIQRTKTAKFQINNMILKHGKTRAAYTSWSTKNMNTDDTICVYNSNFVCTIFFM